MGSMNCSSCFSSKENGEMTINEESQHNNIMSEETFFNKISDYYATQNYEIQKITQQEFFELIDSYANKILNEYEDKLEDSSNLIEYNNSIGPLKFINKYNEKSEDRCDFYYEGAFNNEGKINGKGLKIIPNNLIYKGEFLNEKYNGKGLLIKNNCGSIFGNWENGKCKGKVIYKVDNQFEYEGNYENNHKNGYGIEKYRDGSEYEGNFINDIKNGHGIFRFPNGEIYEGNFENDLYNGQGKYTWGLENRKYEGEFKNGIINGKGIYIYSNGAKYNGYFENGLKNGEGFIEFPDGKLYYGNWLNNESYGNGYLINGNEKLEVIFRHGKIISTNVNPDDDDNNININNNLINNTSEQNSFIKNNKKYKQDTFAGDKDININKYICPICNCFFVEPIKCAECSAIICKECREEPNCNYCNKDVFENNEELIREMTEIVKIKCNKCNKILDYQESLNHFH